MVKSRPTTEADVNDLQKALNQSSHPNQKVEHYASVGVTDVYEDESGPIGFLRYTKALRLCACWIDDKDKHRNAASISQAITDAVQKAKSNGYTEILFETESESYKTFCEKLGFEKAVGNTMILYV